MMEASPSAAFVVAEPDLLLELLVIALDAPAHFGDIDQLTERHPVVEIGEPILGGRGFALWPLDQQRLFGASGGALTGRDAHPHPGKARAQPIARAVPPRDGAPG